MYLRSEEKNRERERERRERESESERENKVIYLSLQTHHSKLYIYKLTVH